MLGWESKNEYLELIIQKGAMTRMTFEQFLEREIDAFLQSPERKEMIEAQNYYNGKHDILLKQRKGIGEGGKTRIISNLPNNILVDNRYASLVDQKTNYLFGQPVSIKTKSDAYFEAVSRLISKKFLRLLKRIGMDAINQGISWVYVYLDEEGGFQLQRFNPYEILPFWKDEDHTELDMVVRIFDVMGYEGTQEKKITKVEVYHAEGIKRYVLNAKKLIPDVEMGDQFYLTKQIEGKPDLEPQAWAKIPVIPFKSSPSETPLLNRVKSLQDALNKIQSHFMDVMEEDARNTILVVVNYEGEDLGEFRQNLSQFGAVKVSTVDGIQGDVKALQISVDSSNFESIIDILKKAIISNGKGFDSKDERSGNSPNELNLKSMYSDIDLDANMTETEFQASFEELLWFFNTWLQLDNQIVFSDDIIEIIFNRDIMVSESSVISDIRNSVGILSRETLVAQHPYIDDVQAELKRIEEEEEKNIDKNSSYRGVFNEGKGDE